ncbi:MAG TPA: hypothetical protein VMG08_03440 [Allosphingosinicella sp.]|nr:hypothetical protein [Allosphingosinicella sp.]
MRSKFGEEQTPTREHPAETARAAAQPRPQPAPRAMKHGLY